MMAELFLGVMGIVACVGVSAFALCIYCAKWHPGMCNFFSRERRRGDTLPSTCTVVRFSKKNTGNKLPETCPICLDDFKNRERIVLTQCRHGYHRNCLLRSLNVNPFCPVCKSVVSQSTNRQSHHNVTEETLLLP